EPSWVDEQREHVVDHAAQSLVAGLDARTAGERRREQLGDHREGVALVAAERKQGTVRLAVHHVRIARRPPPGVDQRALGRRLTLVLRDADLAHGNLARGHVEQQRGVVVRAGDGDANGFVTNLASVPRNGATVARWSVTLTKCSETSPAPLASSP